MIREWFLKKSNRLRWVLNIWPPFLFSGIKVMYISEDYRRCKVKLKNWPGTRNINGTQYGGSLFSMTDPIYGTLFMGVLGSRYYVWDKSAKIDFVKPGVGEVYVECEISDELLKEVLENTKTGHKFFPEVKNIIYDKNKNVVAIVTRTLYIRLKPSFRPNDPTPYSDEKKIRYEEELESQEDLKRGEEQLREEERHHREEDAKKKDSDK